MAEKKVIEIDVNTKDAVKAMENLSKATHDVSKSFEEVYGDLQPLTTRMGEAEDRLYELANAGKTTTQEYKDLLKTVGDYRKVQIQTDLAVDSAATTMSQKLGGALGGVTAGFSVAQGFMGAFGAESEDVEKALLKVQSAMAIAQGVQSFKEAIPMMNGLKTAAVTAFTSMTTAGKAFAVTGIGLLLTGLALAANAMGAFGDSTEEVEKKQKKLEKQLKATNDEIAQTKKSTSDYVDILDGQTQRELNNAKKRGASDKELSNITLSGAKKRLAVLEEEVDTAMKLYLKYSSTGSQKQYDAAADALSQAQAQRDALATELEGMDADAKATAIQNSKDRAKEAREQAAATAKAKQEVIDKADADAKRLELERQQEFDNSIQDIAEQNYLNTLNDQQKEELAVQDKYFNLETLATGNAEALKEIELAKMNELNDINLKYQDLDYKQKEEARLKLAEATKKATDKEIAEAKAVAEQKAAIQMQGLDTALQGVQLIKGLFEKQKGVQKAAVIAESAIGIAKMIIANKLANVAALATPQAVASSGVAAAPVIAMNNISTGIGIAANIAATAKALRTLGGGSPPSSPSNLGGGGAGAGGVMSPNFNVVGNSGLNQLGQLQQKPTKAYVVSGDMTTAQALDRNRIENATLVQ